MSIFYPGVFLCVSIACVSVFLSLFLPLGSVVIAIFMGIILRNSFGLNLVLNTGVNFCEKYCLPFAIALMGVNLNFFVLKQLGVRSVVLIVFSIIMTIGFALIVGRFFGFNRRLSLLLGIGSSICGSSAIAATESIIGAAEEDVGVSITIVNLLGTFGIFIMPFIAKILLHFSDLRAGVLIGNTLQAVGQVVAAGFSISNKAGQTATIIKMARILMLLPVIFILIAFNKNKYAKNRNHRRSVPFFIIGFVFFSLLATFHFIPRVVVSAVSHLSHFLLVVAMAAIGLKLTMKNLILEGRYVFIAGAMIFLSQILVSCFMIFSLFRHV